MTLIAIVPLLVMILGLFMWAFCKGKLEKAGEWMFVCGMLVTLMAFAGKAVRIG